MLSSSSTALSSLCLPRLTASSALLLAVTFARTSMPLLMLLPTSSATSPRKTKFVLLLLSDYNNEICLGLSPLRRVERSQIKFDKNTFFASRIPTFVSMVPYFQMWVIEQDIACRTSNREKCDTAKNFRRGWRSLSLFWFATLSCLPSELKLTIFHLVGKYFNIYSRKHLMDAKQAAAVHAAAALRNYHVRPRLGNFLLLFMYSM